MLLPATRTAPFAVALLLGCTALSSAANAGWFDFSSKPDVAAKDSKDSKAVKDAKDKAAALPSENLDDSIRQAQMLRLAGSYPEAIKHLSQLMMVAADDPRVVSEYGKTLAAMGRSQDAISFLTRAQQFQPGDWTIYSAMGVAQDQMGNQKDAQVSYERALAIKPGEPSVLNNYALSRMLAKDPEMARKLAIRAEIAGGASDEKIARNIAMIRSMAPEKPDANLAVNTPAPSPVPRMAAAAPRMAVTSTPTPLSHIMPAPPPMANLAAPRPQASTANMGVIDALPQTAQVAQAPAPYDNRVVMQRVPVDPLAGPVASIAATTRAPRSFQAKAEAPKPAPVVKTAASQAEDLQARAEAIAKQLTNKPAAIAAAKTEANKPVAVKAEPNKSTVAKAEASTPLDSRVGAKMDITKDFAGAKPGPAPHVLPPAPVKAADAKPAAPAPVKTAAKPKDTIPGLRMSANAY